MPDRELTSEEVGSEGGSPGDLERREDETVHGSEATSTVDRAERDERTVDRGGTGTTGRRSPTGPEEG